MEENTPSVKCMQHYFSSCVHLVVVGETISSNSHSKEDAWETAQNGFVIKVRSGGHAVERRTVNRGGSIPSTAVWKLRQFRSPHMPVSFGRDTKSR